MCYSPWGHKELDTTEPLNSDRCPGGALWPWACLPLRYKCPVTTSVYMGVGGGCHCWLHGALETRLFASSSGNAEFKGLPGSADVKCTGFSLHVLSQLMGLESDIPGLTLVLLPGRPQVSPW